jgi:PAS domain S-box-containing protein
MLVDSDNSLFTQPAQIIAKRQSQIIEKWMKLTLASVPAAREQNRLALIDSLPDFLEQLRETFLARKPSDEAQENAKIASKHGHERADLEDYDLGQVIHEYQILREVLVRQLESEKAMDPSSSALVHRFIDCGIRTATAAFVSKSQSNQNKNERRFRDISDQLNMALQGARMGTWHLDLKTKFLTTSTGTAAIFGLPEAKGNVFEVFSRSVHPEDLERVHRAWQASVSKSTPYHLEYRIVRPDGEVRWVFGRGKTNFDENGNAVSFSGVTGDITERKTAEMELALERHKLNSLFEESPAALALWRGKEMIFEMVNPGYQALFPGRQLLGLPFLEALPEFEGQPFIDIFQKVLETGEAFVGREVLARHRTSESGPIEDHYYDFTYARIKDAGGSPYGVFDHAIDVTERVRTRQSAEESREQLEKSVRELEQERDLRDRFVAALTHDLRNPMTAAKMSAQLISESLEDRNLIESLSLRIAASMNRADRMIHDLLDANRLKAGEKISLSIERCRADKLMAHLAEDLVSLYGPRFEFRNELGALMGYWDPAGIQRIVENLAGNAIKYGDLKSPVTVALRAEGECIELSVHNLGEAIAPENQSLLFEPFRRLATARSKGGAQIGWGIGLSIVKGLAEAHGGSVRLESNATGTTFTVRLPIDARTA